MDDWLKVKKYRLNKTVTYSVNYLNKIEQEFDFEGSLAVYFLPCFLQSIMFPLTWNWLFICIRERKNNELQKQKLNQFMDGGLKSLAFVSLFHFHVWHLGGIIEFEFVKVDHVFRNIQMINRINRLMWSLWPDLKSVVLNQGVATHLCVANFFLVCRQILFPIFS